MSTAFAYDVFVSYSQQDAAWVREELTSNHTLLVLTPAYLTWIKFMRLV